MNARAFISGLGAAILLYASCYGVYRIVVYVADLIVEQRSAQ